MASVNISLREEAYEFLNLLRGKNKSFSDVILEIKEKEEEGSVKNILKFAGALKNSGIDWKVKGERIKEFRASFSKRMGRDNDRN